MIAVTFEYIELGFELFILACTLAVGIGAFCFAILITGEIQRILRLINDKAQAKKNQSNELMVLFSEFIDAHDIVKQLS